MFSLKLVSNLLKCAINSLQQYAINLLKHSIKFYIRFISPYLKNRCIFYPSCSKYALTVLNEEGVSGVHKIIIRILKCNPFYKF
ncbi:membrane protein insertion efficiency factor YidD [Candidatus Cytomitobacter primus]|uniref:Membrane protein insertion efficiency factor YidD n=1 Tax=Candidatus Cytomitobacter primus TaxID=2066024 RepID=A0A5C0UE04_9PROT|nr:membrane protein insertion efficiency factor YidD [Candidatus Cytomitobacter primus]